MAGEKIKVKSSKRGKGKKTAIKKKTRYFTFAKSTSILDLESDTLKIKQIALFAASGKDAMDIELSLWETQPKKSTDKGRSFEILKIKGKVTKANKYQFEILAFEQDAKKFPKRTNKKGNDLWLPAKLVVLDTKDNPVSGTSNFDFVLPPMEYDDKLELQLGCTIGEAVCGRANVKWNSIDTIMKSLGVTKKTKGIPGNRGVQKGKPNMIVIHSMCAYKRVAKLKDSFNVDANLKIFKDSGFAAHFIIDRNGNIVQAAEIKNITWHAKGFNSRTIGIELLGFADQFRDENVNDSLLYRYKKVKNEKTKRVNKRTKKKAELEQYEKSKVNNVKKVTVGGKSIPVNTAIARTEKAIAKLDKEIKEIQVKIDDYDKFLKEIDTDNVPKVFKYTKEQYKSLGEWLEALYKRFAFKKVATHHRVDNPRKTDPGKHFDWQKILPYLPTSGKLVGTEATGGGMFTVNS